METIDQYIILFGILFYMAYLATKMQNESET